MSNDSGLMSDAGHSDAGNDDGPLPTPTLESLVPTEGVEIVAGQPVFTVQGSGITCTGQGVELQLAFATSSTGPAQQRLRADLTTCSAAGFATTSTPAKLEPGTYHAFIEIGGGRYEAPESNRVPVRIRKMFSVTSLDVASVEQGERVVVRAGGAGIDCTSMPTMSLDAGDGSAEQTVTATECDEFGFVLDFSPTVAPGTYRPAFANGNGLSPDQESALEFVVYEHLGLPQQVLVPGLHPSLAARWNTGGGARSLIAAIDPTDGTVFLLPRTRGFREAYGATAGMPHPRVTTSLTANEVRIEAAADDSSAAAYALFWASNSQVGMSWLDQGGNPVLTSPPAIDTTSPTQLDIARGGSFGEEWAVSWRDGAGSIRVALIEHEAASWSLAGDGEAAGSGAWPGLAAGGDYEFTLVWTADDGGAYRRGVAGYSAFDPFGPVGEARLVPFNRVNCGYSRHDSTVFVCDDVTDPDHPRSVAYDGRAFATLAYPGLQVAHPASITSEPSTSTGWIFVSYVDRFGGTTYEVYDSVGAQPRRSLGRVDQAREASVPPDIQGYSNTLGDFFAWVAQVDGNVVLGTLQRAP